MAVSMVPKRKKFYHKVWFWLLLGIGLIGVFAGVFFYKTGATLNKISTSEDSVVGSLFGVIGKSVEVKKADDGRTNILLLGIRGRNVPGGGLLADTIMLVSFKDDEDKVALISIPRDLYVKMPGESYRTKINGVYAHGEGRERGGGIKEMKQIVAEVTGLTIDYGAVINFAGFKQLIDAVGGVDIVLETPFYETTQFVQGKECGGEFVLPKGKNTLNGEKALCYVRARENTSDYDRAKRQQVILQALKDKLISLGTLTDFGKLSKILDALGNNVLVDMSVAEMKGLYKKYAKSGQPEIFQRVFENSPEGKLMVPQDAPASAGFVLIPRAGWDNYSEIHEVCRDIFILAPQSDIKPVKQYRRPVPLVKKKTKKKSKSKVKKSKAKKNEKETVDDEDDDKDVNKDSDKKTDN